MKKIATVLATLALAGGAVAASAAPASAGHCVEGDSPGFSYFGTEHVQSDAHDNEGGPKHAGTPGASNCYETSGNPSERAPGRQ